MAVAMAPARDMGFIMGLLLENSSGLIEGECLTKPQGEGEQSSRPNRPHRAAHQSSRIRTASAPESRAPLRAGLRYLCRELFERPETFVRAPGRDILQRPL